MMARPTYAQFSTNPVREIGRQIIFEFEANLAVLQTGIEIHAMGYGVWLGFYLVFPWPNCRKCKGIFSIHILDFQYFSIHVSPDY